jgi:hypothetical protein
LIRAVRLASRTRSVRRTGGFVQVPFDNPNPVRDIDPPSGPPKAYFPISPMQGLSDFALPYGFSRDQLQQVQRRHEIRQRGFSVARAWSHP